MSKIRDKSLSEVAEVFMQDSVDKNYFMFAGEKALLILYNSNSENELGHLRYKLFTEKTLRNSAPVEAKELPPTSASAKFHSLRVYHQTQEWGEKAGNLNLMERGWAMVSNRLLSVKSVTAPAPDDLLCRFRCNCKMGCDVYLSETWISLLCSLW